MPKINNPRDNIVDEFEIGKILNACRDDSKLLFAVAIAYKTGARISEIIQLRARDFSEQEGLWLVSIPTLKQRYKVHGREQIRKYAKTLHIAGFVPIYGFTDSCYIGIPKNLNETDLDNVTNYFIEQMKKESPNPLDSFGLGVDGKFKFMWFLALNNYLYVKQNDEVGYKGGALFNKNTPLAVLKLFETYIKPKIIRELDVNFKEEELLDKLLEIIKEDVSLAGEEYSVKDLENYNSITSPQYQISQRYGEGKHLLIPNTSGVGVGKKIQLCSLEEFKENNLTIESIPLDKMKIYLRPFYQDYGDVVDLNDDNFNWRCREK